MPTCQCATLYRRNICTLLLGGPAHPRLPLLFQPLSHSVPFCPILCSILFHPLTALVCACSQPSHGPSGMPPVPPLPIQTSTRSLQSYSSLRRAASLVRAHTAALPRLRLSLSHTASALLRAENRASPPPERGCCEDSEDTPANYITSCCVLANARESSLFYK